MAVAKGIHKILQIAQLRRRLAKIQPYILKTDQIGRFFGRDADIFAEEAFKLPAAESGAVLQFAGRNNPLGLQYGMHRIH
ncbi:hypothetical protein D3C80_2106670 [compost metagenome]